MPTDRHRLIEEGNAVSFSVTDAVSRALYTALDGVSTRQRVIADNIANVDTPHYRASSVVFENELRSAIADGDFAREDASVGVQVLPTDTPVGPDGNNVDLRKETLAAMQSQYQYQLLTRAVSDRFSLVRTSLGH